MAVSSLSAFNTQAMRLAAMGVTILAASGDDGATGFNYDCTGDSSSSYTGWSGTGWTGRGYFPYFPATNPYVTAVGATMGAGGTSPSSMAGEVTCQAGTVSSGGVSSTAGGVITTGKKSVRTDVAHNQLNSYVRPVIIGVILHCLLCLFQVEDFRHTSLDPPGKTLLLRPS